MSTVIHIRLNASKEQVERLVALQTRFSEMCNYLSPIVQQTHIWNRVALHHLSYKQLRESFPDMGSQMVCNAIYSVSRTSRLVFQNPLSPWSLDKRVDKPLPLIRFDRSSPVYFDRHTLSLKNSMLSMFTLDGRMRFNLVLDAKVEEYFKQQKLREIVLVQGNDEVFQLTFTLEQVPNTAVLQHLQQPHISGAFTTALEHVTATTQVVANAEANPSLVRTEIPNYIYVEEKL